jgi:hypothetical protein
MAIASVGTGGTAASSANSTSFNLTTATNTINAADNRFAVLTIVKDNTQTTDGDTSEITSVTGGTGTWTKLGEYTNGNGAAGAGVTTALWLFEPSGANATGTVFTMTLSAARTDKVASLWVFSKASGQSIRLDPEPATNPLISVSDAATGFGSLAFSGLTSKARLYFRGCGKEANGTTQITPSTNFTAITAQRSRNNTNAQLVRGEFRINTSTGETSNPTLAITGDTSCVFAALEEFAPPATQNLTQATRFDDGDTHFGPTVAAGAVTLTPALYTNDQTFFAATVTATQNLTPALYTNDQTFFASTVFDGVASDFGIGKFLAQNITTQDITTASLGGVTPDAALILVTQDDTGGGAGFMFGATDGTNENTWTAFTDKTSFARRTNSSTKAALLINAATNTASADATLINNGVQLAWAGASVGTNSAVAALFAGADNAVVGNVGIGVATATVNIGFEADVVIFFSNAGAINATTVNPFTLPFGICVNDGSATQRSIMVAKDGATAATYGEITNNAVVPQWSSSNGTLTNRTVCANFTATGFDLVTTPSGGTDSVGYIALRYATKSMALQDITARTTTGTQAISGLGFAPEMLISVMSEDTAFNGGSNAAFGGMGIGVATPAGERAVAIGLNNTSYSHTSASVEKALAATNGSNATAVQANVQTWGIDGVTLDYTAVSGTAQVGFMLLIGEGGAAQSLTPALFTNDQTFYSATVGRGTVTLTPALFTNTQVFYSPTVTRGTVTLIPARFDNTNTFFAPTLAASITLPQGARFDDGDTFYAATAGRGAVTLTAARFDDGDTFYAATVGNGAVALTAARFDDADTFYAATVATGGVVLAPARFDDGDTFYAATVSQLGGPQTLTPARFDNVSTFFNPAVGRGAVSLTATRFDDGDTFYAATVGRGAVTLVAARYNDADTFYVAAVSQASGPQSLTQTSLFDDGDTFYATTVSAGSVVVSPARFDNATAFYTATVQAGAATLLPARFDDADVFYSPNVFEATYAAGDPLVVARQLRAFRVLNKPWIVAVARQSRSFVVGPHK